ncbi:EamA family transporter [Arthrobacter glacialis]|uniref:EamA family transporter n=1 Tax=Arthrobacter glacialis TaxID=1664 RepID=A0A2S3ZSJ8_ARTGL|nr:EamA family transporter [Arthrobacter glacialis]POH71837.1 EamA family transporter [Arthrobacter glacialis]
MTGQTKTPLPPWSMAVAAMFLIQLSSALSVGLIEQVGAAGTAWLRLAMGGVIFLLIARPPLKRIRRQDVPSLLGLGAASGLMSVAFLSAIEHIPLGTAVAIEFLGPLTVAAIRSGSARMLTWPALALVGVVLLTEPWHGEVNLLGIGFALLAGVGWGSYIMLTQHVGDRFSGISALSMTIPIAAVMAAFVGAPQVIAHFDWRVLLVAVGLALLAPVLPFGLEMQALRRMTHTAFGTLMALEPAIGVLLGLLVLHQVPSAIQGVGIVLVVLAGAAAQRSGTRTPKYDPVPPAVGPAS